MGILRAHFPLCLDALRPVNDERIADPTAIGLALPAAERRIAGERPAPGVVVAVFRPAELVQGGQVLLRRALHVVEEERHEIRAPQAARGDVHVLRAEEQLPAPGLDRHGPHRQHEAEEQPPEARRADDVRRLADVDLRDDVGRREPGDGDRRAEPEPPVPQHQLKRSCTRRSATSTH